MNVLISHSYFYKLDPKQFKFKQPYPPLGTLLAAAVVRRMGHRVEFFDSNLQPGPDAFAPQLKGKPEVVLLYDDGFNYLTKMCLLVMRHACFQMITSAKAAGSTVVVCSSDASDRYEDYLRQGADVVIRGEGERTLQCLLPVMMERQPLESIEGIAFQQEGRVITTATRSVLRNLDELPHPAWDLVNMEAYRKIWRRHHGYFSLNVATTRGCPYKCNWCAKPIYGNRYNSRSPEDVVNEIEFLLHQYSPDHIWFSDDIFGLKPDWVKRFATLVRERKLKFRYKLQSRVDLLLHGNVVEDLAASGAETVWVGAESGSQKILDAMDKGTTVQQIRQAASLLKQSGIKVAFFVQFGYTGEVREDIDKTINMILELMPDDLGVSVSYPLPGTLFYERVKKDLKEKQNWSDSNDLAMMFRSTFPTPYYRLLHRYVHSRYRIQRGINQLKTWQPQGVRHLLSMIYHLPLSIVQSYRLQRLSHADR